MKVAVKVQRPAMRAPAREHPRLCLAGLDTETRQKYRDQMRGTTRAAFARFGERLEAAHLDVAVFGSLEAIQAANLERGERQMTVTRLTAN